MFNQNKFLLSGFFLISLFTINAYASNDTTSALRGDAGVSQATVVVTNVATGISKTTSSDENGVFQLVT